MPDYRQHSATPSLIWVDVETTGLDIARDHLLEVAVVVTDDLLNELYAREWVVHPGGRALEDMNDHVRGMHSISGLLHVLLDAPGGGWRPVEAQLLSDLKFRFGELWHGLPLAGASVHFDRAFLRRYLPEFEGRLSHRHLDVSSFKEAANRWAPYSHPPRTEVAHRALSDIRQSIGELDHYRLRMVA